MRFLAERVIVVTNALQSRILNLPVGKTLAEIATINIAFHSVVRDRIVNTNDVFKRKPFDPCRDNRQLSYLKKWMNLLVYDIASYRSDASFVYYDARLIHNKPVPAYASWVVSSPINDGSQPRWYPDRNIFQGGLAISQNIAIVKAIYSAVLQVGVDKLL